jgi:hypothetical protein
MAFCTISDAIGGGSSAIRGTIREDQMKLAPWQFTTITTEWIKDEPKEEKPKTTKKSK